MIGLGTELGEVIELVLLFMVKRRLAMSNQSTANNLVRFTLAKLVIHHYGSLLNRACLCRSSCWFQRRLLSLVIFFLDAQVLTYFNKTLLEVKIVDPHQQLKTIMESAAGVTYAASSFMDIFEQPEAITPTMDWATNMTAGFTERGFKMGRQGRQDEQPVSDCCITNGISFVIRHRFLLSVNPSIEASLIPPLKGV